MKGAKRLARHMALSWSTEGWRRGLVHSGRCRLSLFELRQVSAATMKGSDDSLVRPGRHAHRGACDCTASHLRKDCRWRSSSQLARIQPPLKNRRTCFEGPFGEVIRATGPMARVNPFRFSTKYQDDETDLLYYGYRFYNASTGRWLSRDPLGQRGGSNLYGFVRGNPITRFDARGLLDGATVPGSPATMLPCPPKRVRLHIGVVEDLMSGLGAFFAGGNLKFPIVPTSAEEGPNDTTVVARNSTDWQKLKRDVEAALGSDCIERLTIGGHGGPGSIGLHSSYEFASSAIIGPGTQDSGIKDFLAFLGSKMCPKNKSVELMVCRCAAEQKGKTFLLDLANLMNTPVVGYDEYFGPGPHGNEWTALPGAKYPDLTWTHSPYEGSLTQYALDRGAWLDYWATILGSIPSPPPY
jgi:RHS repeat-associated protein